jgi:Recombination endonuclease VII
VDTFLGVPSPRRYTTHCPSGHEYTPENGYVNPTTGNRQCRACAVERGRRKFREKLYGLSLDAYTAILERQSGRCAICHDPASGELALAADHDHATGAIRGLLCSRCNNGLGSFRDDSALLRTAAAYLNAEPAVMPAVLPPFVGQRCSCGAWAARMARDASDVPVPICLTCFGRAIGRTGKRPRGRPRLP